MEAIGDYYAELRSESATGALPVTVRADLAQKDEQQSRSRTVSATAPAGGPSVSKVSEYLPSSHPVTSARLYPAHILYLTLSNSSPARANFHQRTPLSPLLTRHHFKRRCGRWRRSSGCPAPRRRRG